MSIDIGVLIDLRKGTDVMAEFRKVLNLELQSCQVCIWDAALYTDENAAVLLAASVETGVRISALWAGWSGPAVWDFYDGPLTLGLVPETYRFKRMGELLEASVFAEKIGVSDVITHAGFIPENPNDRDYHGTVAALRYMCGKMKEKGQWFLFETGQETPTALVRAIEDIGTGNVGINFDTANLILYGKANAVNAAETFGRYVRNLHCKDGEFPTDGKNLGDEKPLGRGRADIARVLEILWGVGYTGPLTIEREISGEKQIEDIIASRELLKQIKAEYDGHEA